MAPNAPDTKVKKFYYRRAVWEGQRKGKIEKILTKAHESLDTVGKRTFETGSGAEIRGARYSDNKGLYLHIAAYVPGEATSIIEKSARAKQSRVTAQAAPDGKDYLDGDAFVFVKENEVIICPSGLREAVVERYIWHILKKSGHEDIAHTFELDKIASASKLKMIKDQGVKEVVLNASLYEASLLQMDKKKPNISNIKRSIADNLEAIFGQDPDLKQIHQQENINVKVSLKFDGTAARRNNKVTGYGVAGRKRLEGAAVQLVSNYSDVDDDQFTIITGMGNSITPDEIRVSESYKVETLGKSLSRKSAWKLLREYYDRLKTEGVFSQ